MSKLQRCATAGALEAKMTHYAPDGTGKFINGYNKVGIPMLLYKMEEFGKKFKFNGCILNWEPLANKNNGDHLHL